jgi:pimeloyl-ACP methyl ester carboxylesterase
MSGRDELRERYRQLLESFPISMPTCDDVAVHSTADGMKVPETRYARSGDLSIAFQVIGDHARDLVWIRGNVSDLETLWEQPRFVEYVKSLTEFSRVLIFDKRGTGLSDSVRDVPTLDARMDDARAVMDAVGSPRAVFHASYEGARLAVLFAATYPERTTALVLVDPSARGTWAPDYPWAPTSEQWRSTIQNLAENWGRDDFLERLAVEANPRATADEDVRRWFVRHLRRSASPGSAVAFYRMLMEGDVRDILPAVRVPTLVLARPGAVEEARYVAAQIPGAQLLGLPGEDGVYWLDPEVVGVWVAESAGFWSRRPTNRRASESSPRSCSRIWSVRRCAPPSWATGRGESCSSDTTKPSADR